jgi:AcrR family transcriptional regulator
MYMYMGEASALYFSGMAVSGGRTRNPRGQGERLRTSLMDAARELLLELGDQDKVSVRAVTARAGVSPNALYLHFADREELLSAVMLAGYKEMRTRLQAAASRHSDPIEQLRAFGLAYLEFAAERPGLYRVLFMTKLREGVPVPARGGPSGLDEGVDIFNDFLEIVTRCLPQGADPFAQAAYLWAGFHGYVALSEVMPAFPWPQPQEYVERMIEIHLGGPLASRPNQG